MQPSPVLILAVFLPVLGTASTIPAVDGAAFARDGDLTINTSFLNLSAVDPVVAVQSAARFGVAIGIRPLTRHPEASHWSTLFRDEETPLDEAENSSPTASDFLYAFGLDLLDQSLGRVVQGSLCGAKICIDGTLSVTAFDGVINPDERQLERAGRFGRTYRLPD